MILQKLENSAKLLLWIYLVAMLLIVLLPINGDNSSLNNNYTFGIRWDYLIHSIVYIPLPILLSLNKKINFWLGIFIALLLASGFELLQMALNYRAFNINDLLANNIGVIFGTILTIFIKQKLDN